MVNARGPLLHAAPYSYSVMLQHLNQTVRPGEAQDYRRHFMTVSETAVRSLVDQPVFSSLKALCDPISSNRLTSRQVPFQIRHFMMI